MYLQKALTEAQQQVGIGRSSTGLLAISEEYNKFFRSGDNFFDGDKCIPTIIEWYLFQLVSSLKKFVWERRPPTPE